MGDKTYSCSVCNGTVAAKDKWELGSYVFDKKSCMNSHRETLRKKQEEKEKREQDDAKNNPNKYRFDFLFFFFTVSPNFNFLFVNFHRLPSVNYGYGS